MTNDREALDPVLADPAQSTVEFENGRVRVLRIRYGRKAASAMHAHPDGVAVWLTDAHGEMTELDGSSREFRASAGEVAWENAQAHRPVNLEDRPFELIQIEFKS